MKYITEVEVEVDVYDVLDSLSDSELDAYLRDVGHKTSKNLSQDVEYFHKVVDKLIIEMKNGYTDEASQLLFHLDEEIRKSLTK